MIAKRTPPGLDQEQGLDEIIKRIQSVLDAMQAEAQKAFAPPSPPSPRSGRCAGAQPASRKWLNFFFDSWLWALTPFVVSVLFYTTRDLTHYGLLVACYAWLAGILIGRAHAKNFGRCA